MRRLIFIVIVVVIIITIVGGGVVVVQQQPPISTTTKSTTPFHSRWWWWFDSTTPPLPLTTTLRSSHSHPNHHHHHHDDQHHCDYYYNTTTNQCFLFPKLDLSITTNTNTTTTTHHHRQLQNEFRLTNTSVLLNPANSDGIRLSQGLTATIIARQGQRVTYTSPQSTRNRSILPFHRKPDGADIFTLPNGGYVYMSNSERNIPFTGGVYGVMFDQEHRKMGYENFIRRTTRNCNGGRTPWETWVTCEEAYLPLRGHCWQIDPLGQRRSQKLTMSGFWGGSYEAFAYDVRNTTTPPSFYITEDASDGTLRRYRPPANTKMGWEMLHQRNGIMDYLELIPTTMTFRWVTDIATGRTSAKNYYRNSEGIAIHNGTLAFVSKVEKLLFLLNLDALTYTAVSTETPPTTTLPDGGSFDAQPDHVISYTTTTTATQSNGGNILFLTEDGGPTPGLFAYDGTEYFTILESELGQYNNDEVTGIAFSPDGTVMYACLQDAGILIQIRRNDAQPFRHRRTLKWRKGLKL